MSAAPVAAIHLDHVSVQRGSQSVLRDISFDVQRGVVLGLIGPSGCGKTTLMRTIVGVQANVVGSVTVLGQSAGHAAQRGEVGYMTQDASVYSDLTVIENLNYFAQLLNVSSDRIDQLLQAVQLDEMKDSLVEQLSGGQRARVSLAIAMLNEPPLLVLDEPTVGLDPSLRQQLWKQFSAIAAAGSTLVVSSHVMDEASRCDALVLMREGEVLATGSPQDLMTRTTTKSVEAAFLALVGEDVPQ